MKKGSLISVVLTFVLLIGGCAGAPPPATIYDSSIPEDQLCTLEIAGGLKVISFNGTVVSWGENGTVKEEGTLSSNAWRAQQKGSEWKTTIRIPAGNHTLQANLYLWDYSSYPGVVPGSGYIRASGLEITHDFQPGQTYFLRPVLKTKVFGKENEEIKYIGPGPTYTFFGTYLRIDENGNVVAKGNEVTR